MSNYPVIAVIDIGSNSIRLQVVKSLEKSYKIIQDYREILRLGDCVFAKGYIDKENAYAFYKNIEVINNLIQNYNTEIVHAVGTQALREAKNADEIIETIKKRFGINIEIISAEKEAYYNYLAVLHNFEIKDTNTIIMDIGGGSAEFVISEKGEPVETINTLLGCSRLKYEFIKNDPPSQTEIYALKDFISKHTKAIEKYNIDSIVCTGGTLNNLANMYYISQNRKMLPAAKYVPRIYLKKLINTLCRIKIDDIKNLKGVEEKRSDILMPAALVLENIMSLIRVEGFYSFNGGLRTGLIIDAMNNAGISLPFQIFDNNLKFARLIEIGNKFNFEERHSICVTNLSKLLFNKLKKELNLKDKDYHLLEASAILHDIGAYISFSKHNLHSYYLIINSDLSGFNTKQKQLIAIISYYHRGSLPKKSHKFYQKLSQKNKERVKKLAAILRIADALDRSHRSFVSDIELKIYNDRIEIFAISQKETFLEIKASNVKKDLLEKITKKKVIIV